MNLSNIMALATVVAFSWVSVRRRGITCERSQGFGIQGIVRDLGSSK